MAVALYLAPRASWDTTPNPKPRNPRPSRPPKVPHQVAIPIATTPPASKGDLLAASNLWNSGRARSNTEQLEEQLGYEQWLPVPPKINNPRSIYNAASLAYLGDCIYELYARRHFLTPALGIDVQNEKVMSIVRCEAQNALLKKLAEEDYLTEAERDILRWGKNLGSAKKSRTKKRASVAVYNKASSLETLIGYLYLTDANRLHTLMYKLGFLAVATAEKPAQ